MNNLIKFSISEITDHPYFKWQLKITRRNYARIDSYNPEGHSTTYWYVYEIESINKKQVILLILIKQLKDYLTDNLNDKLRHRSISNEEI